MSESILLPNITTHPLPTCRSRSIPKSWASTVGALDIVSRPVSDVDTGPFANEVSQTLKIRNPNSTPVAFKVCRDQSFAYHTRTILMHCSTGQDHGAKAVRTRTFLQVRSGLLIRSRYCVRPNSGRIEPGKEVEVVGMCQDSMEQIYTDADFGSSPFAGYEDRATSRCQVQRQVLGSVCRCYCRQRVCQHQCRCKYPVSCLAAICENETLI